MLGQQLPQTLGKADSHAPSKLMHRQGAAATSACPGHSYLEPAPPQGWSASPPRDPPRQRGLTLPTRLLPALRPYKPAASVGAGGRRTSATRGRASSLSLARRPLAPFGRTRRRCGGGSARSRARCSPPSPPSTTRTWRLSNCSPRGPSSAPPPAAPAASGPR